MQECSQKRYSNFQRFPIVRNSYPVIGKYCFSRLIFVLHGESCKFPYSSNNIFFSNFHDHLIDSNTL